MRAISPFLWFDHEAEEAVNFYTSIFKNSKIGAITRYDEEGAKVSGRAVGSVMVISFQLEGQDFSALNGGPLFPFSPAISFFVNCNSVAEIDALWAKLSDGGSVMMPLQQYPFSEKYGWLRDKFGVSWQLNIGTSAQKIRPALMFVGDKHGKAEEAIKRYTSLFPNSGIDAIARYEKGEGGAEGKVKYSLFRLNGQEFTAMENNGPHKFTFTQAISFVIGCDTQEEVDHFWDELSKGGETQQCGWLVDAFGVPWQVVPTVLGTMLADKDHAKAKRVMSAMLKMTKLDIESLQKAFEQ